MIGDKGWCSECRRRQSIVDEHDESYYQGSREVGFMVTEFACGHEQQGGSVDVGPSPGGESAQEHQDQLLLKARQAWESNWQEEHG